LPVILVVRVRVDDDVGSELDSGDQARHERPRQSPVAIHPYDVVDARQAGYVYGSVGASVIDDEQLDDVESLDVTREICDGRRERLLFIVTRNLDN